MRGNLYPPPDMNIMFDSLEFLPQTSDFNSNPTSLRTIEWCCLGCGIPAIRRKLILNSHSVSHSAGKQKKNENREKIIYKMKTGSSRGKNK